MSNLDQALRAWHGEEVMVRFDHETGAWIIIAVHSTRLGSAGGGTRMKTYSHLEAAIQDALNLAEGMTYKFAVAGLPHGGGKAVIAIPGPLDPPDREGLLLRYGELVKQLGGLYHTGPDVGTTPQDMDVIARTGAPHVHGCTPAAGGAGDSGSPTAIGVFHGIKATCRWLFGDDAVQGRRFVVQGAGSVGGRLIRLLHGAGAEVLFSEADDRTAEPVLAETDAERLPLDGVYDAPCDIFAPCALGGILNADTVPRLRCRAVVGSANNQLATEEDAERLRQRDILYAPDFVVSLGGAMALIGREEAGLSEKESERQIVTVITGTLRRIYETASAEDITTVEAARRLADARLAPSA